MIPWQPDNLEKALDQEQENIRSTLGLIPTTGGLNYKITMIIIIIIINSSLGEKCFRKSIQTRQTIVIKVAWPTPNLIHFSG